MQLCRDSGVLGGVYGFFRCQRVFSEKKPSVGNLKQSLSRLATGDHRHVHARLGALMILGYGHAEL